ncbi:putative selenium-dependent hydroxylase accessory protein YqeC [Paenibacillus donghaensis]|uniref:selenium cofactor biosynthesis protein YqeC n=1 Tax=Paenibacillus donghaensis TaxID=414771 RepID=UPI0018837880|nr:selenium cofactor biosynthesis protein YqeC [Paenibacillus donghaensis]MBE9913758.1 putative selenium-dependent hydroxylase accessory protein YqeC [Paenibacillus donghaensis]
MLSRMELKDCFGFEPKEIVALIGSGGKTATMEYLAKSFPGERVLMATTTKIRFPDESKFDVLWMDKFEARTAEPGITLMGRYTGQAHKLGGVSPELFTRILPQFEKAFIEADGSKQRPLKGWAAFEPVILPQTTTTVGIFPIKACGLDINEINIHRLSQFLALVPLVKNPKVTPSVLAQVAACKNGLFAKAKGKRILAINQVETSAELALAKEVLQCLPPSFLNTIERVIAMSSQKKVGWILWEK